MQIDKKSAVVVKESYRQRYRAYMQSPHWKALRWQAIMGAGRICQCCAHNRRLEAHHLNYRNLTDCTVDDLIVLCNRCHTYLHEAFRVNGTKPNMYDRQETINLIHNYCRQQGTVIHGPVCARPFQKVIQSAYKKCKDRQYSRAAVEQFVTELKAVLVSMPQSTAITPKYTPFQQHAIHITRRGSAIHWKHHTPAQQDELMVLLYDGKIRRGQLDGTYVASKSRLTP